MTEPTSIPTSPRDDNPVCVLYDGRCPVCSAQADWLRKRAANGGLSLVDIRGAGFDPAAYHLTREQTEDGLHAVLPNGHIVTRMEAVRAAATAVGLGRWIAPTRWPLLRLLFDAAYSLFARNRHRLHGRTSA